MYFYLVSELWKLKGRSPVVWSIPIYVDWLCDRPVAGRFFHAIPLTSFQEDAYIALCRQFADRLPDFQWAVKKVDLERYAEPCDPQPAHQLFTWEKPQLGQQPEFNPEARADRDEFLDALWQIPELNLPSRDELERLWRLFSEHTCDWLINQEKPVDLYLFKLHLSPYRVGWQDLIHHRFPKLAPLLRAAHPTEQRRILYSATSEDMASVDLLALVDGTLARAIEVEHKPAWWRTVRRIEYKRRALLGSQHYAQSLMGSVRRFLLTAGRLLAQWYHATRLPSGADVTGGLHGSYRLLGDFQPRRVRRPRRLKAPSSTDALPAPVLPPVQTLPPADAPVPALPPVQSQIQDVRDGRGDIPGPGGQPPEVGLLVPDDAKGEAPM